VLESEGEEEEEVVQGLTSHMEMCDFFLFFWTDITGLTLAQVQTWWKVLLHNGGSWNACTIKRCIALLCIPKQSP
jgi:hypothetical protein